MASEYGIEQHFLFPTKRKKKGGGCLHESLGFAVSKVLQSFGNLGILVSP